MRQASFQPLADGDPFPKREQSRKLYPSDQVFEILPSAQGRQRRIKVCRRRYDLPPN